MPKLNDRLPKYCRHRASGQAYVTLDGRAIYLGAHGTAVSKAEYDRRIAEWMAAGRRLPTDPNSVTIAEVAAAFRKHAKAYYRDADGTVSRAVQNFDEALRPVLKLYGRTLASDFGPLRLKTVRQAMIEAGRVRSNVNRHITRIRGVFKWAAENEMIPASAHHGLMAVSGLRRGRCEVQESEPVAPVAVEVVEATLKHVSPQAAAMARLQLASGMRPGEVVLMRGMDLDTSGRLWVYKPARHKTQLHGHTREIYLGPKAQAILKLYLKPDLSACLFSPADAEQARRAALHEARKTPLSCGNKPGSNRRRKPARAPGEQYDVMTYYRAVQRGCERAFPPPEHLRPAEGETHRAHKARLTPKQKAELAQWRADHHWHVHQLRHTAATQIRKDHGLEAAQCVLGHRTLSATQIYAARNQEQAAQIMAAIG